MKEFDVRERKAAILTMILIGVLTLLYELLVPTVLLIRVFKYFVPVLWGLIVLFFYVSQLFFAKDRIVLSQQDPDFAKKSYTPVTSLNGTYKNMLSFITFMNIVTGISIVVTLVGYFYQYKNSALYEYYPIVVTTLAVTIEVFCIVIFTREGKASKYDKEVIKVVESVENWDQAEKPAQEAEEKDKVEDLEVINKDELVVSDVSTTSNLEADEEGIEFGDISIS